MCNVNKLEVLLKELRANEIIIIQVDTAISFINFCRTKGVRTKAVAMHGSKVAFSIMVDVFV